MGLHRRVSDVCFGLNQMEASNNSKIASTDMGVKIVGLQLGTHLDSGR